MAFTFETSSQRLTVTDQGVSVALSAFSPVARVYNSGANDCRISYIGPITSASPIMPSGLLETHMKGRAQIFYAQCETGLTTTLDVVCGTGD